MIRRDMDFHTMTPEQIVEDYQIESRKSLACTLVLSALAELHANAELFGGLQSRSFLVKWKALEKRANSLLENLFT